MFNLSGGNFRRAWQVNDINALILQEVEFAFPIIAHNKRIDMVLASE